MRSRRGRSLSELVAINRLGSWAVGVLRIALSHALSHLPTLSKMAYFGVRSDCKPVVPQLVHILPPVLLD